MYVRCTCFAGGCGTQGAWVCRVCSYGGCAGGACLDCHRHAAEPCVQGEVCTPDRTKLAAPKVVQQLDLLPAHARCIALGSAQEKRTEVYTGARHVVGKKRMAHVRETATALPRHLGLRSPARAGIYASLALGAVSGALDHRDRGEAPSLRPFEGYRHHPTGCAAHHNRGMGEVGGLRASLTAKFAATGFCFWV